MDAIKHAAEESLVGSTYSDRLVTSLKESGLVPGPASTHKIISHDFQPRTQLEVSFDGKAVDLGNLFRARECRVAPSVAFQGEDDTNPHATYTLMLVDPDAPTPEDPKYAFWRHWVMTGLQPLSGDSNLVAATKFPVTAYHPPDPKADSHPHRYLFLLFRESRPLDLSKDDIGGEEFEQRRSFHPAEAVSKFGLTLVGFNWMKCAADDWSEGSI
ncbi:phosphatidylethanolamine-binding protein [Coniella lustricola]|uniref:Phosphatidylethanolamine-binding protein n=1 Tax=Coniella lustricola TaxID=2025994 RepID=A0A2T2ZZM7_9PEZI|nr:phosphatidylethanolamine-binding protein [Coniella lustricola]